MTVLKDTIREDLEVRPDKGHIRITSNALSC